MNQLDDDIAMLKGAGFKALAKQYQAMASALRVIHVWAKFDDGALLIHSDTQKLCERALKRFREGKP